MVDIGSPHASTQGSMRAMPACELPAGKELLITDVTWEAVPTPNSNWISGR
jgi:hypothetical protein